MDTRTDAERPRSGATYVESRARALSEPFRHLPPSTADHAHRYVSDIAATHPALLRLAEIRTAEEAADKPIDLSELHPCEVGGLVARLANRLTAQMVLHDGEALLRAAEDAAQSALESFAEQDGLPFETHAYSVVWTRLQVILRQELEIIALVRERMDTAALEFVNALTVSADKHATEGEVSNLLDDELGGLVAATLVALVGAVETLQKEFPQLDRATVGAHTAATVHSAMAALSVKERLFLEQRYWRLRNFEDIAVAPDIASADARVVHPDILVRVGRRLRRQRSSA